MENAQNILIIGATSAIAEATARIWASERANLHLVARNPEKLALVAGDLGSRGARVTTALLDVNDFRLHAAAIDTAFQTLGHVDAILIAHGDLPNQQACEASEERALIAIQTNATSVVLLLTLLAKRMQAQGTGVIAVIGSVAGDRGRKSNYLYGSCKALVATFMEGLAGRLKPFGVRVMTIKPGLVDTPMTEHLKKGLLWARPPSVAGIIHKRMADAHSGSYYAPTFWWVIMAVIRSMPSRILYRLNI